MRHEASEMISWTRFQRDVVVIACAGSAGIHAALVREHLEEGIGPGLGFLVSVVLLTSLVVALARKPGILALAASVAVLAGLIGSYALATTTGVPLLHPEVEPIEGLALATNAIEAVGLVAALHLLGQRRPAAVSGVVRMKGVRT